MTAADSAGAPWAGRTFAHHDTEYRDDDGSMPQPFANAMRALLERGHDIGPVVEALRGTRLLVPLVAEAGATGTRHGRTVEKSQELSIVLVEGPDGLPLLPMFSSVEAMHRWRADARPVPASVERAAAAALEDGSDRIVLDAGHWSEIVLRRSVLEALLTGGAWMQTHRHPLVRTELVDPLLGIAGVLGIVVSNGDPLSRLGGREVEVVVLCDVAADQHRAEADLAMALRAVGERRELWAPTIGDAVFELRRVPNGGSIASAGDSDLYRAR